MAGVASFMPGAGGARRVEADPRALGLERLRRAFRPGMDVEPDRSEAPVGISAVLLPVYELPEAGPALLYTQRAETLRRHPGEVSFPGGRVDPGDPDPLAAALREAHEEVGIVPEDVEVLGHLTDYLTYQGVLVCAYVGAPRGAPPTEPASLDEVARVFTVPVRELLSGERYEARRLPEMVHDRQVHYWHVPPKTVWGVTGELTARFLHRAYAWRPPREARVVRHPSEFRPAP